MTGIISGGPYAGRLIGGGVVAVQAYWAWQFAAEGNAGDTPFWLLVTLWGSFGLGYVYNEIRH